MIILLYIERHKWQQDQVQKHLLKSCFLTKYCLQLSGDLQKLFSPNYFESLSKTDVENKWLALEKYISEIKKYPYPRSREGVFTLSKYRGIQSANRFAEAFRLIREIKR